MFHLLMLFFFFFQIKVNYDQWYQKDAAELKVEPIYKTLPNARVALNGTTPEPRFIWKEKNWPNGFPNSPKEANTDVMTYLEQKDCYQRLQKLNVKDFCVGSIVSVTRSDPYVPKGNVKYVLQYMYMRPQEKILRLLRICF